MSWLDIIVKFREFSFVALPANVRADLVSAKSSWLDIILSWLRPSPKPKPEPVPEPVLEPVNPGDTSGMLVAINHERAINGKGPLVNTAELNAFALAWAKSMATTGVLTHGNFSARVNAALPGRTVAENVAEGQQSVPEVVASWMGSPGHRANILGPYTEVGYGMARRGETGIPYWDAVFSA